LAVCFPSTEFTLVERMRRRTGFLRNTIAILGLSNVKIEEAEMENLSANPLFVNKFNMIVFRAWKPLSSAYLEALSGLLAEGGIIAAYKGRRESIEEEMSKIPKLRERTENHLIDNEDFLYWKTIKLNVPFLDEERHLLLIRKK
jgi:16S rRNA (guanine527-N7)-methyltransferase